MNATPSSIARPIDCPRLLGILLMILCLGSIAIAQQGPEEGAHEIQVWTGVGHSVPGGTAHTGVWNAGLRYGWVLTDLHGPGFLRGSFEYAVEAVPFFLVFQPANTTFGGGVNPLGLKWNFVQRGSVVPYLELNGGTLFTTQEVPTHTSTVNFTSGAAFGAHFLRGGHNLSVDVRYMHISNAGLTSPNPGINTFQVRVGFGAFRK